jgi:hypothetical protein
MLLFAFFPWCAFWLLWRLLTLKGFGWRSAFLAAQVISGVLIVVSTEVLSPFRLLNFPCLLLFWTLVCSGAVLFLRKYPGAFRLSFPAFKLSFAEKVLFGCGILVVAVVGMIALIAPPNTADSMAYHMARVMHWLQNASVGNYPTGDYRQLVYPPYAEYAILQAQILTVSDRFANLVQWTAMIGSVLGVSLIAKALGADRRGQILTALFMLTIPMGILQGSSTQTDYVATLWVICGAVFLLQLGADWGKTRLALSATGLGLAVLTKGTGLVFGLPFVLLWPIFFGQGIKRKAALVGAVLAAIAVLNGAFYVRLHEISRNPFAAPALAASVAMERTSVVAIASNAMRNVASELALPWETWDRFIERPVIWIHHSLGIDPADKSTTAADRFSVGNNLDDSLDEDCANNFLLTVLALITGALFWFAGPKSRHFWFYSLALVSGALFFCASVKWQPWIGRFHLPFYVLLSPFVVLVLARVWPARALVAVALVLVMGSVPYLFWNNSRRILSEKSMFLTNRSQVYFAKNRAEYGVYQKIADALAGMNCRDIGLHAGAAYWQYSWWPLLGWPKERTRIEHVAVSNLTAKYSYPLGAFAPCALIVETTENMPPAIVEGGRLYARAGGSWVLTVYLDIARLKR